MSCLDEHSLRPMAALLSHLPHIDYMQSRQIFEKGESDHVTPPRNPLQWFSNSHSITFKFFTKGLSEAWWPLTQTFPASHQHLPDDISCHSLLLSLLQPQGHPCFSLKVLLLQGLCHDCQKHSSPDICLSWSIISLRYQLRCHLERPFPTHSIKQYDSFISLLISLSHWIFFGYNLIYFWFTICLLSENVSTLRVTILYPQHLQQCPVQNRCSLYICWLTKWMNDTLFCSQSSS